MRIRDADHPGLVIIKEDFGGLGIKDLAHLVPDDACQRLGIQRLCHRIAEAHQDGELMGAFVLRLHQAFGFLEHLLDALLLRAQRGLGYLLVGEVDQRADIAGNAAAGVLHIFSSFPAISQGPVSGADRKIDRVGRAGHATSGPRFEIALPVVAEHVGGDLLCAAELSETFFDRQPMDAGDFL